MASHPKFYFFDAGVFRTLRPMGPLDTPEEAQGAALETLFLQEVKAVNDYSNYGYALFYWRAVTELEVDFVLYGPRGIRAFEIKRKSRIQDRDLKGLKVFLKQYPMSKAFCLYGGERRMTDEQIEIIPFVDALKNLPTILS